MTSEEKPYDFLKTEEGKRLLDEQPTQLTEETPLWSYLLTGFIGVAFFSPFIIMMLSVVS